jgi:hypothetical protein
VVAVAEGDTLAVADTAGEGLVGIVGRLLLGSMDVGRLLPVACAQELMVMVVWQDLQTQHHHYS